MKVEIAREDLARLLDNAKGLVERRGTMPALHNVLLQAQDEELVLRSTDLAVTYTGRCNARVEGGGELCLPAHKLAELVKLMPAENVYLEAKGHDAALSAASVRYNLRGLDPADFPPPPENEAPPLYLDDGLALQRVLGRVSYAAASGEMQRNLNGVHLQIVADKADRVLRLTAADGHRMAVAEMELVTDDAPDLGPGLLLPIKGASAMHRVLIPGAVTLGLSRDLVTLNTNGDLLHARPLDCTPPDYSMGMPKSHDFRAIIPRAALVEVIKRVAAVATDKFSAMTMSFGPGILELSAGAPDVAEASDHLEVAWDGQEMVVGINPRYLRDACERLEGEEVILDLGTDPMAPVKIHSHAEADEGCLASIAPMDVSKGKERDQ